MIQERDIEYLTDLVDNLRRLPRETEWVEFKVNQATDPEKIGEYLSALSNGAALNGKDAAYMLWGIEDDNQAIVGTGFKPAVAKKGGQSLERWLRHGLNPRMDIRFHEVVICGMQVIVLEIEPATRQPVAFYGKECIRIGDVTTNLREHPEKERALWRFFDRMNFESEIALERASDSDVLEILNCPAYFERLGMLFPDGRAAILDKLQDNRLIMPCEAGGWNITNLAAVLFARNLGDFPVSGENRCASSNTGVTGEPKRSESRNSLKAMQLFLMPS